MHGLSSNCRISMYVKYSEHAGYSYSVFDIASYLANDTLWQPQNQTAITRAPQTVTRMIFLTFHPLLSAHSSGLRREKQFSRRSDSMESKRRPRTIDDLIYRPYTVESRFQTIIYRVCLCVHEYFIVRLLIESSEITRCICLLKTSLTISVSVRLIHKAKSRIFLMFREW